MRHNKVAVKETVTTHVGSKGFNLPAKEELAFAVLTTFMEDKYYEKNDARLKRIQELVEKVGKKDPTFIAKLAIYARAEAHMRSVFPVLIGELTKYASGTNLVRKAIFNGTCRVDDVTEICAYLGKDGITSSVKRGISDALNKFDSYGMAKYQSKDKDWSLVDVVNFCHPKGTNRKTQIALKALMNGTLKNTDTWEAKLSSGEDKAKVFHELIDTNKLGYMALLRNLRNILETGDNSLVKKACKLLTDKNAVANSKQLPFRFLSAYNAIGAVEERNGMLRWEKDKDNTQLVRDALNKAVQYSVMNIPKFEGRSIILSDNSGSMRGDAGGSSLTSAMSKVTTAGIANLFATLFWTRCENTLVGLFGQKILQPKLDRKASVFKNFKIVNETAENVGPANEDGIFQMFEMLIDQKTKADRIVIFSDSQIGPECRLSGGAFNYRGSGFNALFDKYMKMFPDCEVYSVNLQGYSKDVVPDKNITKISGWSDKIFDIMAKQEIESGAMVKEIEQVCLD